MNPPRRLVGLLVVALVLFVLPSLAPAARWHPDLRWHTLDTEHFSIHFHQGGSTLAAEFALLAEEVHDILAPAMRWTPRGRTQVTLVDSTDSANGFARTVPGNQIVLFVVQPGPDTSLDGAEDWWFSLFVHEYAHIVQIDMAEDLLQLLRFVFGRLVLPNSVLPGWMTEGFATYIETITTTSGRGRSTYTEMLLRVAALEGTFPRIDVADGLGSAFPRGQLRYLYGARFHLQIAGEAGLTAWSDFHHRHARGPIPFFLPAQGAFGRRFVPMWKEWREAEARDALRDVERIAGEGTGITATRVLPSRAGEALAPIYTSDGESILYVHRSPSERTAVRGIRRDGSGDHRAYRGGVEGAMAVPGGEAIWASLVGDTGRYTSFQDLFRIALDTGKSERLTIGARVSWPAPHPDGNWLVAVQSHLGGTQLVRVDLPPDVDEEDEVGGKGRRRKERAPRAPSGDEGSEGGAPSSAADTPESEAEEARTARVKERARVTPITAAQDSSHYATPAWDPAGERLAVSVGKPGGFRDIHVLGSDGRLLRTLTWDRATDTDPTWSPDGRWLVFASDRDGVFNLYAWDNVDGSLARVTRLLGGARHPDVSPDGRWLVFQGFGREGWRVEELPFAPERWEPVVLSPRALPGPTWGPSAQALAPNSPLEGLPGPPMPWGNGHAAAVARDRALPDFTTLATPLAPPIEPAAPGTTSASGASSEETRPEKRLRRRRAESGVLTPGVVEEPTIPGVLGPVHRYNPLRTLFPPRYLAPFGSLTDTGAVGGLAIGGYDALEQHAWSASLQYATDSRAVGGAVSYTLNAFHPRFSVGFSSISVDYGRLWERSKAPSGPIDASFAGSFRSTERYFERRSRLSVGVAAPLGRRQTVSARYNAELRSPIRDLPDGVDPRLLPARGSFSGIGLGWAIGEFRRFPTSVSPEDDSRLLSVALDVESSYLGAFRLEADGSRSELHRGILTVEGRTYQTMPWLRNHVVALRFAAGVTLGTAIPQRTFRIGGAYGDSPFLTLPDRYYALRGYPTSSMRGDHLALGTVEYRFPLVRIERGILTAPLWLRSVSVGVFAEAGQVFDSATYAGYGGRPAGLLAVLTGFRPAVGAELIGDVVLGWGGLFVGRVGYAYGFGEGAFPSGTAYVQLGSSF